jgi:hypothetical protein
MDVPIAGSLWPCPDIAETLRKSHAVSGLVGAVVGALIRRYGVKQTLRRSRNQGSWPPRCRACQDRSLLGFSSICLARHSSRFVRLYRAVSSATNSLGFKIRICGHTASIAERRGRMSLLVDDVASDGPTAPRPDLAVLVHSRRVGDEMRRRVRPA